jgi:hypothetical protein
MQSVRYVSEATGIGRNDQIGPRTEKTNGSERRCKVPDGHTTSGSAPGST